MEPDGFRFDFCPAAGSFEIFDIDDGLEKKKLREKVKEWQSAEFDYKQVTYKIIRQLCF